MNITKIFISLILLLNMLLISGCCCCSGGSSYDDTYSYTPPSNNPPQQLDLPSTIGSEKIKGTVLKDGTTLLKKGEYLYYTTVLDKGDDLNMFISASGGAVDVMVIGAQDFNDYTEAVNDFWNGGSWNSYISEKSVITRTLTFTIPSDDRYYIVIDNTRSPNGGAEPKGDVNVYVKIAIDRSFF